MRFLFPITPHDNITVDIYNTHTQSDELYTGEAEARRLNQLKQVLPEIENSDADLVIFGGDFNDYPGSRAYAELTRKLVDAALEKDNMYHDVHNLDSHTFGNRHNLYTYNTKDDFKRTLDYIVFRRPGPQDRINVRVMDFRIPHHVRYDGKETMSLSDHEQVEVTFDVSLK